MQMAKLAEWIVAGVIAAAPVAQAQQGGADEARIKRIVDGIVQPAMRAGDVPGVGVGITLHGKHYFFGYGQATDGGAPFRADTEVEIGSVTKIFTTAMLAQAVNAAKMSLNDPA